MSPPPPSAHLGEVARYFFRLGVIAFGGPAAHIAIMRRELVQQRRWVSDQEFIDLLGVTNLIPGPNSTEMTMHLGASRGGWRGLWLGGAAFILPAVAIVLGFAWAYVEYGGTTAGEAIIFGIQPFILAIIVQAIWGLRGAAFKGLDTLVLGAATVAGAVAGVNEVILILGAGAAMLLWRLPLRGAAHQGPALGAIWRWVRAWLAGGHFALVPVAAAPPGYAISELFLVFLKVGAVLYGSGYVLVAFLESDLVASRAWLTEQQLIDAIAIGQFTPGPVFTTATAAGYIIDGLPGAAVATLGIFLPSFLLVSATHPLVPRLRESRWASHFLDGVNVAAIALMGVVTARLGLEILESAYTVALFVAGAAALIWLRPNSAWLVLVGALAGLLHAWAT